MANLATIKELQQLLADTYGLYLKTQNYHWHVKGPHFKSLHELFESQYNRLAASVDAVAERILILGGQAPATFKSLMALTNISDGDPNLSWNNMVSDLSSDQDKMVACLKQVMAIASKEEDEGTVSMASGYIEGYEKNRWFLENHLA